MPAGRSEIASAVENKETLKVVNHSWAACVCVCQHQVLGDESYALVSIVCWSQPNETSITCCYNACTSELVYSIPLFLVQTQSWLLGAVLQPYYRGGWIVPLKA